MPNVREDLVTTTKYAVDLISGDRIIPKHDTRVVQIEWIEDTSWTDKINVIGYFEDDGEGFERVLDHDSQVKVVEHEDR
jgi:hypothetical protein